MRPGLKLRSAVCDAQVVVVRAPSSDVQLTCGGAPMLEDGEEPAAGAALDASLGEGPQLGKRYFDEETGLEVLCARGGSGALAADGRILTVKGAKPLPASD